MKDLDISIGLSGFLKANDDLDYVLSRLNNIGYKCFDLALCLDWNKPNPIFDNDDYIDYYSNLKELAEKNNTYINQTHGFFPLDNQDYKWLLESYKKQIHATNLVGAKYIVIHPIIVNPKEEYKNEVINKNIEFLNELIPELEKYDVCACLENLWEFDEDGKTIIKTNTATVDELNSVIEKLNDDKHFGICIDTGHMNLCKLDIPNEIRKCKEKLKVLHINDNDGYRDSHLIPTQGVIDFNEIIKALDDIEYTGSFNMEVAVYNYIKNINPNLVWSYGEFAYKIAEALVRRDI